MSTRFFTDEGHVLESAVLIQAEDGWHQATGDDADVTLSGNINESYMTAAENDNTQYFSVLETTSESELNATLEPENHMLMDEGEETAVDGVGGDGGSGQVTLFKVGNTEELYGIQVAHDGEGNMQKYQFKVRYNEDGNLEAVPETIKLLPIDCEIPQVDSDELNALEGESNEDTGEESEEITPTCFIKQEMGAETEANNLISFENEEESEESEYQQFENTGNIGDTKRDILSNFQTGQLHVLKAEINAEQEYCNENSQSNEEETEYMIQVAPQEPEQQDFEQPFEQEENFEERNDDFREEDGEQPTAAPYEQLFIKETHVTETSENFDGSLGNFFVQTSLGNGNEEELTIRQISGEPENESDNDDYQLVDGPHVTGDQEPTEIPVQKQQEKIQPLRTRILKVNTFPNSTMTMKSVIKKVNIKRVINPVEKQLPYLIVHSEKENVENNAKKPNPRSILKTSQPVVPEVVETKNEEKFEKRFAKSKEAIQARQFHNFINQTTIIHAPVRQERLPRKQTIKPVERTDEEIIVQEVVVSSNGFIETTEDGVLKERVPIKTTACIQLSDSDDDYDPKKKKNKKKSKKRKNYIEITISDTEDEEGGSEDVITVDSDESETTEPAAKRKRGRPPKNSEASPTATVPTTPRKRGRPPKNKDEVSGESDEERGKTVREGIEEHQDKVEEGVEAGVEHEGEESNSQLELNDLLKTENKCTKCPKTFPSQGSLRTHMQYHNFEEAQLKSKMQNETCEGKQKDSEEDNSTTQEGKTNQTVDPTAINKHKCDKCSQTFKNLFLLTRHQKSEHPMNICSICKKTFEGEEQLAAHKRSHIKQQICKMTVPDESLKPTRRSSGKFFKCDVCSRTYTSEVEFTNHVMKHRQFLCDTCGTKFLSKTLLHHHVREKCVKSPMTRRLASPKRLGRVSTLVRTSPRKILTMKRQSVAARPSTLSRPSLMEKPSIAGRPSTIGKVSKIVRPSSVRSPIRGKTSGRPSGVRKTLQKPSTLNQPLQKTSSAKISTNVESESTSLLNEEKQTMETPPSLELQINSGTSSELETKTSEICQFDSSTSIPTVVVTSEEDKSSTLTFAVPKTIPKLPGKSRTSLRRSVIPKPSTRSTSSSRNVSPSKGSETPSKARMTATCDECGSVFHSLTALYKHGVLKHNVETADKSLLEVKPTPGKVKKISSHGGVPANPKFKESFAAIRKKLEK